MSNIHDIKEILESLRKETPDVHSYPGMEGRIRHILEAHTLCHYGWSRDFTQVWHRGRVVDEREGLPSLMQCIYPTPAHVRGFGRANFPGEPILYASWNIDTVFVELGPHLSPGKFVQVVSLRPLPDPRIQIGCFVVGAPTQVFRSSRVAIGEDGRYARILSDAMEKMPDQQLLMERLIDGFLSNEYMSEVDRLSGDDAYFLGACFAKAIFSRFSPIFARFSGILYPSVPAAGSVNLALRPEVFDQWFEILKVELYEMLDYYGYGIWNYRLVKASSRFDADGNIDWKAGNTIEWSYTSPGGQRPVGNVIGWRVPR